LRVFRHSEHLAEDCECTESLSVAVAERLNSVVAGCRRHTSERVGLVSLDSVFDPLARIYL
jgi:hypothetical protein